MITKGDKNGSAINIRTHDLIKHFRGTTDNIITKREIWNKVITDAGRNYIISSFTSTDYKPSLFNYHGFGTGTAAESTADTALDTAVSEARVAGEQSTPASNQYRSVATVTFSSNYAITEHGLFNALSGGTLLDRTVFAAVNVASGDSIQGTFTLTMNSGG